MLRKRKEKQIESKRYKPFILSVAITPPTPSCQMSHYIISSYYVYCITCKDVQGLQLVLLV